MPRSRPTLLRRPPPNLRVSQAIAPESRRRRLRPGPALALGLLALAGQSNRALAATPSDPFEPANRASFGFSRLVDRLLLRPVNGAYHALTPPGARRAIGRMVANLGEPSTAINDIAQGRGKAGATSVSRFAINSTVGVLGMFDVAARAGLAPHANDFGQTLGRYGVGSGPYLFIPVLGPSNVRDGLGRIVDFALDPVSAAAGDYSTTFGATRLAVTAIDTRSTLDPAIRVLDDAADPYAFTRSAVSQAREAVINGESASPDLPDFDATPPEPPSAPEPRP